MMKKNATPQNGVTIETTKSSTKSSIKSSTIKSAKSATTKTTIKTRKEIKIVGTKVSPEVKTNGIINGIQLHGVSTKSWPSTKLPPIHDIDRQSYEEDPTGCQIGRNRRRKNKSSAARRSPLLSTPEPPNHHVVITLDTDTEDSPHNHHRKKRRSTTGARVIDLCTSDSEESLSAPRTHPNKRTQSAPADSLAASARACRTSKHTDSARRSSWGPNSYTDAVPAHRTKPRVRFADVDDVRHRNRNGAFDSDEFHADEFHPDEAIVEPTSNRSTKRYSAPAASFATSARACRFAERDSARRDTWGPHSSMGASAARVTRAPAALDPRNPRDDAGHSMTFTDGVENIRREHSGGSTINGMRRCGETHASMAAAAQLVKAEIIGTHRLRSCSCQTMGCNNVNNMQKENCVGPNSTFYDTNEAGTMIADTESVKRLCGGMDASISTATKAMELVEGAMEAITKARLAPTSRNRATMDSVKRSMDAAAEAIRPADLVVNEAIETDRLRQTTSGTISLVAAAKAVRLAEFGAVRQSRGEAETLLAARLAGIESYKSELAAVDVAQSEIDALRMNSRRNARIAATAKVAEAFTHGGGREMNYSTAAIEEAVRLDKINSLGEPNSSIAGASDAVRLVEMDRYNRQGNSEWNNSPAVMEANRPNFADMDTGRGSIDCKDKIVKTLEESLNCMDSEDDTNRLLELEVQEPSLLIRKNSFYRDMEKWMNVG